MWLEIYEGRKREQETTTTTPVCYYGLLMMMKESQKEEEEEGKKEGKMTIIQVNICSSGSMHQTLKELNNAIYMCCCIINIESDTQICCFVYTFVV